MERPNIVNREPEKKSWTGVLVLVAVVVIAVIGLQLGGVIHLPMPH